MRRLDMETIIICAVMAMAGAVGLVAGVAAFAGIQFQECDGAVLTGICLVLGGVMWGILLIFNSNPSTKRVKI
ncbi:MAG: hypothetical protein J6C37_10455 [Roseburia sp.]|nr:hypothetical protein [Roseburia sp.]